MDCQRKVKLEKARIYRTKILLANSEKRDQEAITVGIQALRMFGIRYMRKPSKLDLLSQLLLVRLRSAAARRKTYSRRRHWRSRKSLRPCAPSSI